MLEYAEPTKELFERVYDEGARIIAEEHIAEEEEAFLKEEEELAEKEALGLSIDEENEEEDEDGSEDNEIDSEGGSELHDNFAVNLNSGGGGGSQNQKLGKVALPPINKKDDRVITNGIYGSSNHRNSVTSVSKMGSRHLGSFRGGLSGIRSFNSGPLSRDIAARRQSSYSINLDSNRRRRSSFQKLQLCYSVLPAGCQNVRYLLDILVIFLYLFC